jgi:hypothetical protein
VLAWAGGNQSRAAAALGINQRDPAQETAPLASAPIDAPRLRGSLARAWTHRSSSNRRV